MRKLTSFSNNEWDDPAGASLPVLDKYSGEQIAEFYETSASRISNITIRAQETFHTSKIAVADRVSILLRTADGLNSRRSELIDVVVAECGQTLNEAEKEVDRAILTLKVTAEEVKRIQDVMVPVEGMPGGEGKLGYLRRHPIGVVCAITAYNSPLNTPVHKIAPALAAGNAVVIKPPSVTPISTAILCDVFAEAGLPGGWLSYVVGSGRSVGAQLLQDKRFSFYHFTGSSAVGEQIAKSIGLRQSSLELGSIAATIVCADADIPKASADIVRASFAKAGQVCTSTQIVYAEKRIYRLLLEEVVRLAEDMRAGDPRSKDINIGPMISEEDAKRVESWKDEAISNGAKCHLNGERKGSVLQPTILSDVPELSKLICDEVFGPVVSVVQVADVDEAIRAYNSNPYGLAAGVFTNDLSKAFYVTENLRAGTVHVNSASSSRLDPMPFGGVQFSGHGKEGPKYAIEEMTEQRLCLWHGVT